MPAHYSLHDQPNLVWFRPNIYDLGDASGWMVLDHQWAGFSCMHLVGWVKPVPVSKEGARLIEAIQDEDWLANIGDAKYASLDYSCTQDQRAAYEAFLRSAGLTPAEEPLLGQAVYPVGPTESNLRVLGAQLPEVQAGAQLLVLGHNCD